MALNCLKFLVIFIEKLGSLRAWFLQPNVRMEERNRHSKSGINQILEKYRRQFRIDENLNYYSKANYKIAERKYLKYVLEYGDVSKTDQ